MDIRLETKPVSPGARALVLTCQDCQRPTAHEQYPNKPAHCMFCDASQVPCAGNCGLWVPEGEPGMVQFCGTYCQAEALR